MKQDPGSNYTLAEELQAAERAANTYNGTGVDHAIAPAVSFFISVGDVTGGATVDVKAQYADESNFSDAADYPASDPAGNDDAIVQITASGSAQLDIPNPRGRYTRCVLVVAVAGAEVSIMSVLGPNRHITPS